MSKKIEQVTIITQGDYVATTAEEKLADALRERGYEPGIVVYSASSVNLDQSPTALITTGGAVYLGMRLAAEYPSVRRLIAVVPSLERTDISGIHRPPYRQNRPSLLTKWRERLADPKRPLDVLAIWSDGRLAGPDFVDEAMITPPNVRHAGDMLRTPQVIQTIVHFADTGRRVRGRKRVNGFSPQSR
jgi:hypothetical protein